MKQFFSSLSAMNKKRFFRVIYGIGFLFALASAGMLYFFLYPEMRLQSFVPLHYNVHFGVDLIGQWWQLFTTPAIALVIILLNGLFGSYFWRKEKVLSYFFASVAALCSVLLFTATIFIVLLNITYYG